MSLYTSGSGIVGSGGALLSTSSGGTAFAANRPGGLTTYVDRQWNPTDSSIPGGVLPPASLTGTDSFGMTWFQEFNVAPLIDTPGNLSSTIGVTVPTLPSANATCMAIKYPSGFGAGNCPFGSFYGACPTKATMYICCEIFIPSTWTANGNNIKFFIIEQGASNNNVNHVAEIMDGSRIGWYFLQGGGQTSINYGGADSKPGSPSTPPGAVVGPLSQTASDSPGYYRGSQLSNWHIVEWLTVTETASGTSGDGKLMGWVDNFKTFEWDNINFNLSGFATPGFNTFSLEPFYGGGGSAAPADEYFCVGRTMLAMG